MVNSGGTLKSFIAIVTLLIFNAAAFAGSPLPALDILKDSAADFVISPAPEAQPPLAYRIFELPEEDIDGEELFDYLHEATEPVRMTRAITSYKTARKKMYSYIDNTGCDSGPGIVTFYSQICVSGDSDSGNDYPERWDRNKDGKVDRYINAEHIWPQGYFNSRLPMVADLHHLRPTWMTPNSYRGNLKFGEVTSYIYSTSAGSLKSNSAFEPADAVKGDVARAMLYFVVRYHDKNIRSGMNYRSFWENTVPTLLKWNRQDPPDSAELRRNDLVEDYQGNRNPFIDHPYLADRVGEMVFRSH